MTAIVGIETAKGVLMGADSAALSGWNLDIITQSKVFRSGPFIIGSSGSVRGAQVLRYSLEVTSPDASEDIDAYMATQFMNAVRNCFTDAGFAKKENEVETTVNAWFMVGVMGHLFDVSTDYSFTRTTRGYNAIGSGAQVALGAMYATPHLEPSTRCEIALAAAAEFSAAVAPPFVIIEGW